MALSHDRKERVSNPDGYGKRIGECGDIVEFFLTIKKNVIEGASYDISGCMNTNASAATLAEMARGKSLESAWEITDHTIIDFLQTLPEENHHCAQLAVGAFYLALSDYEKKI